MTRKETALENLRKAVEEFNALGDYAIYIDNVIWEARKKNISEIELKISYYKEQTEKLKLRKKVADYFASPEGSKEHARAVALEEEIQKKMERLTQDTIELINQYIIDAGIDLGSYQVTYIDERNNWVFKNPTADNSGYLRIEIYFATDYKMPQQYTPKINVATVGTVDLIKESIQRDYYIVTGKLFEAGEKLLGIFLKTCGDSSEYKTCRNQMVEELDRINSWLSNPFNQTLL